MTRYDFSGLLEISRRYDTELLFDEKLAPYTSFKIGGPCCALFKPRSEQALIDAAIFCSEKGIPFHLMGKGSNMLISGKEIDCAVLLTTEMTDVRVNGNVIESAAGVSLSRLCRIAEENSLTGLEFAFGIPGTVGGALYMNAGAYGGEMADIVKSCRFLHENREVRTITAEKMDLSYRHSAFKDNKGVILSVEIQLENGEKSAITNRMNELTAKRKEKQPLDYPSAGSTFKRPHGDYAARLIEECGLKGFSRGGAAVSEKHAGFVINTGGATFDDVIGVIEAVREKVYKKTGVLLECEVEILK